MERGGGNENGKREWKEKAEMEKGRENRKRERNEVRVGGNERGGWKGMLDIFTPRRLRGGVKIRGGEFLGVEECRKSLATRHPPRPLRARTPPRKRRRV